MLDCRYGIWGSPTGGYTHDHILLAWPQFAEVPPTQLWRVFVSFDGASQRVFAAGDNKPNLRWIGTERGRAFGCVERGDTSAGPGTDVDQPTPATQ